MKVLYLSLLFCLIYLNCAEAQGRREHYQQCFQQNGERVCCRGYGENRRCEAQDNGRSNDDSDEQNGPRRIQRGRLTEEQREQFRENCRQRGPNGCRQQQAVAQQRRHQKKQNMKQSMMERHGMSDSEAEQRAEHYLQKIFNAKLAVMKAEGLEDIEPTQDGRWEGDLKLSEEQADHIAAKADQLSDLPSPDEVINQGGRRRKRNGIIFDSMPDSKWPNGQVKYYISPYFTGNQKQMIRDGLQAIQAKSCIRFQEVLFQPSSPYIYYKPTSEDGICGQSPLGMQSDVNEVDLNFDTSSMTWMRRCIQHETMHSLGVKHTQSRFDRDKYITLQAKNIDPQDYYNFAKVDPSDYSSFGVQYEGKSIMHYVYNAFSINGQPTIATKSALGLNARDLGANRAISDYDAQLLNRMYSCSASPSGGGGGGPTCTDNFSFCGSWASYGFCGYIRNSCRKSCGSC